MYAEAKRLESTGYLEVAQEDFGRRRKILHLTDAGRRALADWFASPTDHQVEIRDTGLLKLFFSDRAAPPDVAALAADRLAYHRTRLELYRQFQEALPDGGDQPGSPRWADRPVRMGIAYEQMAVEYWEQIAADVDNCQD
jgi:DNA-binding MarR family transcriptional regulator